LAQRINVVTGARSGMGKAVALLLRQRGEAVIGVDLSDCEVNADLSTDAGRRHLVAEVGRLSPGGIDAVIACAGLAISDGSLMIAVNYFGVVATIEGLAPMLRPAAPRVVAISSMASVQPNDPEVVRLCLAGDEAGARARAAEGDVGYASSKRALSLWIRRTAVRSDWAGRGVLLNAIAPGLVSTPMIAPMLATEEGRARLKESVPYATPDKVGPEAIAPLLAFLAGPENQYIVGQTVFCDGGAEIMLAAHLRADAGVEALPVGQLGPMAAPAG